jgi:hypothetical protein
VGGRKPRGEEIPHSAVTPKKKVKTQNAKGKSQKGKAAPPKSGSTRPRKLFVGAGQGRNQKGLVAAELKPSP